MFRQLPLGLFSGLAIVVLFATGGPVLAQLEFERQPILYSRAMPRDSIARLKAELESGQVELSYDKEHGYLPALLKYANVPTSSQVLVFSKTSLQRHNISPRTPRALYFNDDTYIGWVQNGDVVEISTAEPTLGGVFYTLDQRNQQDAVITRKTDQCLVCHASTHTERVPGHIMRSVYVEKSGLPIFSMGTHRTNDASPFQRRWGGWYVTGTHGSQRHMGNELTLRTAANAEDLDREAGANVSKLDDRLTVSRYLTEHSDIIALMVLGHQVNMHNRLTAANYSGQFTGRDTEVMNRVLERPKGFESDSAKRRYASAAKKVVNCLLMVGEYDFNTPIRGTSAFATEFTARGPFDTRGRSLRQLDLQRRLFRYPCSFLIYSPSFDRLPARVLADVYHRLWAVLTNENQSHEFSHLTPADRRAILEILVDTKQGLPAYWQSAD